MANKAVEVCHLSYIYPDGARALKDISFDIDEGETVAVVGPNGSGKTTFLLHLNGLLSGEGFVSIFGVEVEKKTLKEVRKNVGLVFQDPDDQLFMPTVFEDVAFGPVNIGKRKDEVAESVCAALRAVDMSDASNRLSHHLSLGEKKRVAIATVLSMDPRILVLDEPSSNLDPRHRRDLINLLNGMSYTKIIATHDLDLVLETCSRAILLDRGKLVVYGNAFDILSNKTLLEEHNLEVPPLIRCADGIFPRTISGPGPG